MAQYLNPHQARRQEPSMYENLLGDAIERAFAAGHHDLPALVQSLNEQAVPSPDGQPWTPELFAKEMQRLSA